VRRGGGAGIEAVSLRTYDIATLSLRYGTAHRYDAATLMPRYSCGIAAVSQIGSRSPPSSQNVCPLRPGYSPPSGRDIPPEHSANKAKAPSSPLKVCAIKAPPPIALKLSGTPISPSCPLPRESADKTPRCRTAASGAGLIDTRRPVVADSATGSVRWWGATQLLPWAWDLEAPRGFSKPKAFISLPGAAPLKIVCHFRLCYGETCDTRRH
jgi:hypothetical protein